MSVKTTTESDTESIDHPLTNLTGFRRDLLYVVAELDAPSGLEIKAELEADYGQPVGHGRLYPNLDRLVEDGYLRKGSKNDRTNEYTLSEKGLKAIEQHHRWVSDRVPEVDAL